MSLLTANLFADVPDHAAEEIFTALVSSPKVRIERIVSTGHSTPPGEWYDQPQDEWVALLRGSAQLQIEGEPAPRQLRPGDWVLLPAHCRHRLEATSQIEPTIWLAVYFP